MVDGRKEITEDSTPLFNTITLRHDPKVHASSGRNTPTHNVQQECFAALWLVIKKI
jgi:hypothetical protein